MKEVGYRLLLRGRSQRHGTLCENRQQVSPCAGEIIESRSQYGLPARGPADFEALGKISSCYLLASELSSPPFENTPRYRFERFASLDVQHKPL
jgi:hypothetical protein